MSICAIFRNLFDMAACACPTQLNINLIRILIAAAIDNDLLLLFK